MAKTVKTTGKMSEKDFVLRGIESLRKGSYRGIHTRYSGFNDAFRKYFGEGADPVGTTKKLAEQGVITIRPCKGGVMIYKAGDAPAAVDGGAKALAAMGIS